MSFGMNSLLRPPTSSFTKRDLWCQSNGERLYSVLVEPRNARGARPAIVCAHAFGGSFRDTLDFAESMARAGYVAAAIDFRGGSSRSQSEGEVENASVATMTRDIESVVAEVRSLRSVDSDNVFVMGQGEGASAAMRVAASATSAFAMFVAVSATSLAMFVISTATTPFRILIFSVAVAVAMINSIVFAHLHSLF